MELATRPGRYLRVGGLEVAVAIQRAAALRCGGGPQKRDTPGAQRGDGPP